MINDVIGQSLSAGNRILYGSTGPNGSITLKMVTIKRIVNDLDKDGKTRTRIVTTGGVCLYNLSNVVRLN